MLVLLRTLLMHWLLLGLLGLLGLMTRTVVRLVGIYGVGLRLLVRKGLLSELLVLLLVSIDLALLSGHGHLFKDFLLLSPLVRVPWTVLVLTITASCLVRLVVLLMLLLRATVDILLGVLVRAMCSVLTGLLLVAYRFLLPFTSFYGARDPGLRPLWYAHVDVVVTVLTADVI